MLRRSRSVRSRFARPRPSGTHAGRSWARAPRLPRSVITLVALLTLAVTAFAVGAGAQVAPQVAAPAFDFQSELRGSGDADARTGVVQASAAQLAAVEAIGADARWNEFGTPSSMIKHGDVLASGLSGDAVTVARSWLRANRGLFRLSEQGVDDLELLVSQPLGSGRTVVFRQRFNGLPAAMDGLVSLAVKGGSVVYVSSSIAADTDAPSAPSLTAAQAFSTAAAVNGRRVDAAKVQVTGQRDGWSSLKVEGLSAPQFTRLAALPTPNDGVRLVHDSVVMDNSNPALPVGSRELVDANTGKVWLSEDLFEHASDDPEWSVFPSNPKLDYSSDDIRELWCWEGNSASCDREVQNPASPFPWDVDTATGLSTNTSAGNNARSFEKWHTTQNSAIGTVPMTPSPTRTYTYPWTNQWFEERCNPTTTFTSPQRNDIDAALANLFVMHNRMHDWSYRLGFTEQTWNLQNDNFGRGEDGGDPEMGNAQAGGVVGGPPAAPSRDNANQGTGPDGQPPVTNMFLWQPLPGGFYAPCVDGDYDMAVIAHEYGHAISNRQVAGPDAGYQNVGQSGGMGESWSDLFAMEYLQEYGLVRPEQTNPFAIGAYATGDDVVGIRNYAMNKSPLNYSDIAYDLVGLQVHADGEIWSATNFDIRQALIRKYDKKFPAGDRTLQVACADGKVPVDKCPGNRRWVQLVFDGQLLLAQSTPTFVDHRDSILASDFVRFGGANQKELWDAFARRGLGQTALSEGHLDQDPDPSFISPHTRSGTVQFRPFDLSGPIAGAKLFIGHYEGRVVPVADTDPATPIPDTVDMIPGEYDIIVQAPGHGAKRGEIEVQSGRTTRPLLFLPRNLASAANGATASGDGINTGNLIDDTEASNWASLGSPVAGKKVTVRLDPSRPWHWISRANVSAQLRPQIANDPGGDTGTQNRFSALRKFELWTCVIDSTNDCAEDTDFRRAYTSPSDAFPAVKPRPRAPELKLDTFRFAPTRASVVQLRVATNQCTGAPDYAGDQDDDPNNVTDCTTGSPQANIVRAAELQLFNF
jgi:extracellular elastinolytic metalloproteinase